MKRLIVSFFVLVVPFNSALAWIKVVEKKNEIVIIGEDKKPQKESPKPLKVEVKFINTKEFIKERAKFYAKKYNIPADLFLKLIEVESNFNPNAVSAKGAVGLCQLMPETAKKLGIENPYDIEQNLEGGAKYLSMLFKKYKDWKLAIAAYNAGETAVEKYRGVPPFQETLRYLKKIFSPKPAGVMSMVINH